MEQKRSQTPKRRQNSVPRDLREKRPDRRAQTQDVRKPPQIRRRNSAPRRPGGSRQAERPPQQKNQKAKRAWLWTIVAVIVVVIILIAIFFGKGNSDSKGNKKYNVGDKQPSYVPMDVRFDRRELEDIPDPEVRASVSIARSEMEEENRLKMQEALQAGGTRVVNPNAPDKNSPDEDKQTTGTASVGEGFNYVLNAGTYKANADIPEGVINIEVISGQGDISTTDGFSETFGLDGKGLEKYEGIRINSDTELTISDTLEVSITYHND